MLLICKISCSFCTYTVIHLWHDTKYDVRNWKIIGFQVYLVQVSDVLCHLSTGTTFWSVCQRLKFGEFEPHRQLVFVCWLWHSQTRYVAVNRGLISWGATVCCCQMCWLLVIRCLGSALYTPCVHRLASVIYAPFRSHLCQFGDYEETALTNALEAIPMVTCHLLYLAYFQSVLHIYKLVSLHHCTSI